MNIQKLLFLLNFIVIFGCTVTSHTGDPNAPLEVGASCDVYTYGIFECDRTGTKILRCENGHWVLQSDCSEEGGVCAENGNTTGCVPAAVDDDGNAETESEEDSDVDRKESGVDDGDHTDTIKPDADTAPDKTIAPGKDCAWLLEQLGATEAYACYGEQALYCGEWEGAQWRTWGDDCADDGMYCHVSEDYSNVYCASYPSDTDPFDDVDWAKPDSTNDGQPDEQDVAVDQDNAPVPDVDSLATDSDQLMDEPTIEQWGSDKEDLGLAVAVDAAGNVFVTGRTLGGVDGQANAGGYDVFLTKWNASGEKEWTRQWGSANYDYGYAVAVNALGDIFVTGYTEGSLDGNTGYGSDDVFLTKWNADGTKAWTRQGGTNKHEYGHGVSVDPEGAIFVVGRTLGSFPGYTNKGGYDIFLTKWKADGTKAWTRQWGSNKHEYGHAVVVNGTGDAYVIGRTLGSIDLNMPAGDYDIFVSKWDGTGVKVWTRQWGTSKTDHGYGGAIGEDGALFVTGYVTSALPGLTYAGAEDVFLSKWSPEGTLSWIGQWGTASSDKGNAVAVGTGGQVYVVGTTGGSLGSDNLGGTDIFLSIIEDQ